MAQTEFGVTYDGPALEGGTMEVRDLAPALLALGDLFATAGKVAHPDRDAPSLSIKATNEGSFEVFLMVHGHGLWDQVVDLLSSHTADALSNLKDLVLVGLFLTIQKVRGRRIKSTEQVDPQTIKLTLIDGETIEIAAQLLPLLLSVDVRKATRQVVEPLTRHGVESVTFATGTTPVTIRSEDVWAFAVPDVPEEVLIEQTSTMVVTIASVAFIDGNKWRLTDGEQTFHAALVDHEFRSRVDRGVEAFRNGDMLKCEIRMVQTRRQNGLHTEREIVKVIEHIPRGIQLSIGDLDDADDDPGPTEPSVEPEV